MRGTQAYITVTPYKTLNIKSWWSSHSGQQETIVVAVPLACTCFIGGLYMHKIRGKGTGFQSDIHAHTCSTDSLLPLKAQAQVNPCTRYPSLAKGFCSNISLGYRFRYSNQQF